MQHSFHDNQAEPQIACMGESVVMELEYSLVRRHDMALTLSIQSETNVKCFETFLLSNATPLSGKGLSGASFLRCSLRDVITLT
jgi:hypothetical protein